MVVYPQAGALAFVALAVEHLREASVAVAALEGLELQVGADVVVHVGKAVALKGAHFAEENLLDTIGRPVQFLFRFIQGLNHVFLRHSIARFLSFSELRLTLFGGRNIHSRPRALLHLCGWVQARPLLRLGVQVAFGAVNSESFFKAIFLRLRGAAPQVRIISS